MKVLSTPPPGPPFSEFVKAHEAMLYRTALRLCGNPNDARDLVQDTFERGLRSYDRYQPQGTGSSWLVTILKNLFIDRCRARAREPRESVPTESLQDDLAVPEPEAVPAWSTLTKEQVRAAVAQLSPEFRAVYELHEFEGRSYAEIAKTLGIQRMTVGTRLMRARRRLKQILLNTPQEDGA